MYPPGELWTFILLIVSRAVALCASTRLVAHSIIRMLLVKPLLCLGQMPQQPVDARRQHHREDHQHPRSRSSTKTLKLMALWALRWAPYGQGRAKANHFAASTFTRAFGTSPNISGAYMASTRLGGKAKSPTLFRRTVYSILTVPLGRYS